MKKLIMQNKELIKSVAEIVAVPEAVAYKIISIYQELIKEAVQADYQVKVGNLGSIRWDDKKPRYNVVLRNPQTGEIIPRDVVPGHKHIVFKVSPTWQEEVKSNTSYYEEREDSSAV